MQNTAETWCGMQWGDYRRVLWQNQHNSIESNSDFKGEEPPKQSREKNIHSRVKRKHAIRVLSNLRHGQWRTLSGRWDRVTPAFPVLGVRRGPAQHLRGRGRGGPRHPPLRPRGKIEQQSRSLAEIPGDIWRSDDLCVLHPVFGEFYQRPDDTSLNDEWLYSRF